MVFEISALSNKRSDRLWDEEEKQDTRDILSGNGEDWRSSSKRIKTGSEMEIDRQVAGSEDVFSHPNRGSLNDVHGHAAESRTYDTCFGALHLDIAEAQAGDGKAGVVEAHLQFHGASISIHHTASKAFVGLVERPAARTLVRLVERFKVVLQAFTSSSPSNAKSKTTKATEGQRHRLQVVVYGYEKDGDDVGEFLASSGCYLQHPQSYDTIVAYDNPHHLRRPASSSISLRPPTPPEAALVGGSTAVPTGISSSRIQQLLECARGPDIFTEPSISPCLTTLLMPHQRSALVMMFEKEAGILKDTNFTNIWEPREFSGQTVYRNTVSGEFQRDQPKICRGGILADEMGMGKTLTTLAFIASSRDARRTAAVDETASPSTIPVWEKEIQRRFKAGSLRAMVYHGSQRSVSSVCAEKCDIVLTTYDTLSAELYNEDSVFTRKWLRIVLDEAHLVRDASSKRHQAACSINAEFRWCLTGTPIQNKVEDFAALLHFLQTYPFDPQAQFRRHIIEPIRQNKAGSYCQLERLIQCTSLRRMLKAKALPQALPKRTDKITYVDLNADERDIYNFFKVRAAELALGTQANYGMVRQSGNVLLAITYLRQICNDSKRMLSPATLTQYHAYMRNLSIVASKDGESCAGCQRNFDDVWDGTSLFQDFACGHVLCEHCCSLVKPQDDLEAVSACPSCSQTASGFDEGSVGMYECPEPLPVGNVSPSSKMLALMSALEIQRSERDPSARNKSVVFSRWTKTLDLVASLLKSRAFNFERIDGTMSLPKRQIALENFTENPLCDVIIMSIDCAGFGLNLTVANCVHLIEPQWNPMAEEQALARVHRIGQTREVCTIRCIVRDSIEEYVQQIQRSKTDLINRTMTETQPSQKEVNEERIETSIAVVSCLLAENEAFEALWNRRVGTSVLVSLSPPQDYIAEITSSSDYIGVGRKSMVNGGIISLALAESVTCQQMGGRSQ